MVAERLGQVYGCSRYRCRRVRLEGPLEALHEVDQQRLLVGFQILEAPDDRRGLAAVQADRLAHAGCASVVFGPRSCRSRSV